MRNYYTDFFVYAFPEFTAIPVNGTITQNLTIQADSDFEALQLAYHASLADAAFVFNTRPIPNVAILLTDTGAGRQLMNAAIPLPSIAGWGDAPYNLPTQKIFGRNSTIQCALTNFDAAVATYNITISIIGRKIFQMGPTA